MPGNRLEPYSQRARMRQKRPGVTTRESAAHSGLKLLGQHRVVLLTEGRAEGQTKRCVPVSNKDRRAVGATREKAVSVSRNKE